MICKMIIKLQGHLADTDLAMEAALLGEQESAWCTWGAGLQEARPPADYYELTSGVAESFRLWEGLQMCSRGCGTY